jgi:CHAT domain-containing protein/tetratricopeptide (TPR) repeat protein
MSINKVRKEKTKGCLGQQMIQLVFTGLYIMSITFLWTQVGPVKAILVSAIYIVLVLTLGFVSGFVPILGQTLYFKLYSIPVFWYFNLFGIDPASYLTLIQFGLWLGLGVSVLASINWIYFIISYYRKAIRNSIIKMIVSIQNNKIFLPLSNLFSLKELKCIAYTFWGVMLWNRGKLAEGRNYIEKAYELGKEIPNTTAHKLPLLHMGTAYLYYKQPLQALACFQELLEGEESAPYGLRSEVADGHWGYGTACMQLGKYQEALDHFLGCVSISREHNNILSEVKGLKGLAHIYSVLGQHDEAIACLQGSLKRFGGVGSKSELGDIYNLLGTLYWQKGDTKQALAAFEQALKLLDRNNPHSVVPLHNIGTLYSSMGRVSDAIPYLQQALALKDQFGKRPQTASTLNSLGSTLFESGNRKEALAYFQQALSIFQETGDRAGEANTRQNIAIVLLREGDSIDAETEIQKVIDLSETVRTELISDELRTSFFIKAEEAYRFAILNLLNRFFQSKDPKDVIRAFNLNERRRSRTLLDLVAGHISSVSDTTDRTELGMPSRIDDIRSKIMQIQQFLLLDMGDTSDPWQAWRRSKLQAERDRLEAEFLLQRDTIQTRKPRCSSINRPDLVTHDEILSELLDPNTALLEYFISDPFSCLWVITKQYQAVYRLLPRTTLEPLIRSFIQGLNSPEALPLSNAYVLYQMLIQAAESIIKGKRLVIVADDILSYLPFSVLLTEFVNPNQSLNEIVGKDLQLPYLIRNHPISYIPSVSVLKELRRIKKETPGIWKGDLLAIADPLLPATNDTSSKAVPFPESFPRGPLTALPGTRREVQAIASLFDTSRCIILIGSDATKKKILTSGVANYRYVHFATHALVTDDQPDLSGLLLSADIGKTCFLTPFDIVDLDLSADMVVLSACNTGKGKLVNGEGVLGLSRAFLAAGANTVVVSLWRVEDESTALLMRFFYETLTDPTNPSYDKAKAMQQAQLKLMADPQWSHPNFWAPFVVIGDWN